MVRLSSLLPTAAMALCLGACSPTAPSSETILLRIQGTVRSAADASPVQGAHVILGAGGHFTFPRDLAEVRTDEQGRYSIEYALEVRQDSFGGCQLWIRVSAAGFRDHGGTGSSLRPGCVANLQQIDIVLEP